MAGEFFTGNGRFTSWLMPAGEDKTGRQYSQKQNTNSSETAGSLASNTFGTHSAPEDIFGETAGSVAFGGAEADTNISLDEGSIFSSGADFGGFDFGSDGGFDGGACVA